MLRILACLFVLLAVAGSASAEVVVKDDTGATIRLVQPARRIVSLAPNVTEILYAAGAGDRLVGAVEFSNHPEAARQLPRIGSFAHIDLETVMSLRPDLAIGWASGNSAVHVAKLRALGIPVYLAEPVLIEDVAKQLERFGELAGTRAAAHVAAEDYRNRLAQLRARYGTQSRVRTFYEIWKTPLMTVGGAQVISDAIHVCGGENIFAGLKPLAPLVTVEAVIAADPEAIVASGMDEARPEWLDDWRQWQGMTAVRRNNLFFIPPDIIQRHTPRLILGVERLCAQLETARSRRSP